MFATCCVAGCHKKHRKDRVYYCFPRKNLKLAGKWWDFCESPQMDSTWDKFICDLHFQDSDFTADGRKIKNKSVIPSIKGEELKRKIKTLGITDDDGMDNPCEELSIPSVPAEEVLDKSLIKPLKNISKHCTLFIKDSSDNNKNQTGSTEVELAEGSTKSRESIKRPMECAELSGKLPKLSEGLVGCLQTDGANVKPSDGVKVSDSHPRNLKFTINRQVVRVNPEILGKIYVKPSHHKKKDTSEISPMGCSKKKSQNNLQTMSDMPSPLVDGKHDYTRKLTILKQNTSSKTILGKPSSDTSESPANKKLNMISSLTPQRTMLRPILPKPIGSGVVSNVFVTPSKVSSIINLSSLRKTPLSKRKNNSFGSECDIPSPSTESMDESIYDSSFNFEEPMNISSQSINNKRPMSFLIPLGEKMSSIASSGLNFNLPRPNLSRSNVQQKLPSTSTTIFSHAKCKQTDTVKVKPLSSLKKSKKDLPTIKIKRRKFKTLKRDLEVTSHFQKRTLSKRYTKSAKTTIDLSDPKYSIAATAKTLDKTYAASENSVEQIDLRCGEWNKLFVPGKSIFSPATVKSNIATIIHYLRQRLPCLNDRDKLEVRFLLNMMSMYPEAPDHLKEQLVERLNLVYVATLFKWETAISLAADNKPMANLVDSDKGL